MNFYEFYQFLNENTVNQELKKFSQKPLDKQSIEKLIIEANMLIRNYVHNHNSFSSESKKTLSKWIVYSAIKNVISVLNRPDAKYNNFERISLEMENQVTHNIPILSDFLISNLDNNGNLNPQLSSKFNNPSFTYNELFILNSEYHENLKKKQRNKPGREGKVVLTFPDGYFWTDLERKYCEIEKDAMGHCGNVGGKTDDTILSLRDSKNIPHLTFILNNGILGEMKGKNNNKPSEKYHSYIIELLKLPIIKNIKGGGYLPENNFKLSDLTKEQFEELIKLKPEMEESLYIPAARKPSPL